MKHWKAILLGIIVLGAFLRFFQLGEMSLVSDEFLEMNAAYGYAKTGEWQAWDFNNERVDTRENQNADRDERAFAYRWQVAKLFDFVAPTEANARAVSALWGLVTLFSVAYGTWLFSRKKSVSLLAAFLYAVSVSALTIDRRLRMYAMFVPVFWWFALAIFFALEREYRGKMRLLRSTWQTFGIHLGWAFAAGVLGALGMHLHLLSANIGFVIAVYALLRALRLRKESGVWQWNKYWGVLGLGLAGVLGAKIIVPEMFALFASSFSFPDNHYSYASIALRDYAHPLLAIMFAGIGVRAIARDREYGKEGLWMALLFVVPLFLAVFAWDRNVGEQYISFAQPFKMVLIAWGAVALAEFVASKVGEADRQKFLTGMVLGSALLLPNFGALWHNENLYAQTSHSDRPAYRKIFGYVKKKYTQGEVIVTRDLRGYYLSGLHAPIENLGGEITKDKLTLERLQSITAQYEHGWAIFSENDEDFVSNDAMKWLEQNTERISNDQVRGDVSVWRW